MNDIEKLDRLLGKLERRDAEIIKLKNEMYDYFENNNVPMHQVNTDGIIVRANTAELKLLGYEENDYVGHYVSKFHHDKKLIELLLIKLVNNVEIWQQPAKLIAANGKLVHVLITSSRGKRGLTRCLVMPTCIDEECPIASLAGGECPKRKEQENYGVGSYGG